MKTIKVLIADDKPHYIAYLARICNSYGLECTSETDPEAVVARIKANEFFDILIIDLSFTHVKTNGNSSATLTNPKTNGVKILELAKHTYLGNNYTPYIPILCVASGTKELYKFEQKAGIIFDFIERPFKDAIIKQMIEKAIKFLTAGRSGSK